MGSTYRTVRTPLKNAARRNDAGDISFIAPLLPSLDGLGVGGMNAHSEGEYMNIDSLVAQTKSSATNLPVDAIA